MKVYVVSMSAILMSIALVSEAMAGPDGKQGQQQSTVRDRHDLGDRRQAADNYRDPVLGRTVPGPAVPTQRRGKKA